MTTLSKPWIRFSPVYRPLSLSKTCTMEPSAPRSIGPVLNLTESSSDTSQPTYSVPSEGGGTLNLYVIASLSA